MAGAASHVRLCFSVAAALALSVGHGTAAVTGPDYHFDFAAGAELQETILGTAPQQGWLGGDHVSSFHLTGQWYLWAFGNSLTNLSAEDERVDDDPAPTCNYFPARSCAMPTNTFALLKAPAEAREPTSGLEFHMSFDNRSGQVTSTMWPPGWGGSGHSPKDPFCTGCSLWQAPTELVASRAKCGAANKEGILEDKGGCCSVFKRCVGYCCHQELYFRSMTGIASVDGRRILLMAQMGRESEMMPDGGDTYGTYAISVSNAGAPPPGWSYVSARMPDTQVWPWSKANESRRFYTAVVRARGQEGQEGLIYLMGYQGNSRVLARAKIDDLLDFNWNDMEFWAEGYTWKRYELGVMPRLQQLWEFKAVEFNLHWDDRLGGWLVPEVDHETQVVLFRVAPLVTGPWRTELIGSLPADGLGFNLHDWDVQTVKSHPELSSGRCHWVLSIVFHWKRSGSPPPEPGLHYFPRLLCITRGTSAATTPPMTTTALPVTTAAPPVNTTAPPTNTLTTTTVLPTTTSPRKTTLPGTTSFENGGAVSKIHASAGCVPDTLRKIENSMACSDVGDGCHTCRKRAEWVVKHNGDTTENAYSLVARDFPIGCGGVLQCKAELVQHLAISQDWDVRWHLAAAIARSGETPAGGRSPIGWAPRFGACVFGGLALVAVAAAAKLGRSWQRCGFPFREHVGEEATAREGVFLMPEEAAETANVEFEADSHHLIRV